MAGIATSASGGDNMRVTLSEVAGRWVASRAALAMRPAVRPQRCWQTPTHQGGEESQNRLPVARRFRGTLSRRARMTAYSSAPSCSSSCSSSKDAASEYEHEHELRGDDQRLLAQLHGHRLHF